MYKMFIAHVGFFLLVLHLFSSQVVQAQTGTEASVNKTMSNSTSPSVNTTEKSGCGNMEAFTLLLLPLALGASLLHGWS